MDNDPILMWKKLQEVHVVKQAGALDTFFSIRKQETGSLVSLTARIHGAMQKIQSLRPDNFSLQMLDEKLFCITMIRSLPEEYNTLITSLLLKGSLSKDAIIEAFQAKENQRQHRATLESFISSSTKALATFSSSSSFTQAKECDFCGFSGHLIDSCWRYHQAQREEKKKTVAIKMRRKQAGR